METSREYSKEGRPIIIKVYNQETPSWKEIKKVYKEKTDNRNIQTTFLERWNQDKLVSEWWAEKCV